MTFDDLHKFYGDALARLHKAMEPSHPTAPPTKKDPLLNKTQGGGSPDARDIENDPAMK